MAPVIKYTELIGSGRHRVEIEVSVDDLCTLSSGSCTGELDAHALLEYIDGGYDLAPYFAGSVLALAGRESCGSDQLSKENRASRSGRMLIHPRLTICLPSCWSTQEICQHADCRDIRVSDSEQLGDW